MVVHVETFVTMPLMPLPISDACVQVPVTHIIIVMQVLLKIGLQSTAMGLALIDYLLRGYSQRGGVDLSHGMHGHRAGTASESTIDILYQLGVTQNDSTQARYDDINIAADSKKFMI